MMLPHPTPHDALFGTSTLYGECRGEPEAGIIGVAWVIVTRCQRRNRSVPEVVLDPWDFSCWNDNAGWRQLLLAWRTDRETWQRCASLWIAVTWGARPDPTHGADHYLNVDVVNRVAGRLPDWAADPQDVTAVDPRKLRAVIGRHHFLDA